MTDEGRNETNGIPEPLRERIEAFRGRWLEAINANDLARVRAAVAEGQALAGEVQAALAPASGAADTGDVDDTAALVGAITDALTSTEEAAPEAWKAVPLARDEAREAVEAWRSMRDGDEGTPAAPDRLARLAPAFVRRVQEVLFPGERAGEDDGTALMNAVARAWAEGGIGAAREAWRKHEAAGIAVSDLATWTAKPKDREWLVPGWLARGRVALFTGQGGGGKSRATLQLAAGLAAGADRWIKAHAHKANLGVKLPGGAPVSVVIATWEDEFEEVARRLWALGAAGPWGEGRPVPGAIGERLHVADMAGAGPLWAPRAGGSGHVSTMGALTGKGRWLRRLCVERAARLLVVDPLAAAFASDENNRGLVRGFMADWDHWGRESDCGVVFVAHPPKNESEWSGSTDWQAASRSVWTLRHDDTGTGGPRNPDKRDGPREKAPAPRLACIKSSYGPIPDPVWLRPCGAGWLADDAEGAAGAHGGAAAGRPSRSRVDVRGKVA